MRLAACGVGHEARGEAGELAEAPQTGAQRERGQPRCVRVAQRRGGETREGGERDAEEEERGDRGGERVHPKARVAVYPPLAEAEGLGEVLAERDVQEGEQEVPEEAIDEEEGEELEDELLLEVARRAVVLPPVEQQGDAQKDVPVKELHLVGSR